jgi:arylsulfatase A
VLTADDMGYGDLASYGNPTIRTPRLDRMAAEGIRFTSFYAAAAVCTPSRAAFLTGRYAVRSGLTRALLADEPIGLRDAELTLAELLRERGYRTALVGKWHLGDRPEFNPTRHGFDSFLGLPYSNDVMPPWVANAPPVPLYRGGEIIEQPVAQPSLTARFTDEAVRIIGGSRDRPFFLYVAYAMPHLPISASERFRGRSRGGLYGDAVEELDWSVGRILDALREAGLDRRTMVVFTSDNGPWLEPGARMLQGGVQPWDVGSPGPLRGSKATTWEGGMRVPAIARWPGVIPAGQVSAEIATNMDLFPTFAAVAGASVPASRPLDGVDLLPLLRGRAESPRTELFYFAGARVQAVRDGRWKLRLARPLADSAAADTVAAELYDLDVDPSERHDRAVREPVVTARLRARLHAFSRTIAAQAAPEHR